MAAEPEQRTDAKQFHLKGNMGTVELLFTVLAFSAPLGVVFGFLSYNIKFGIGVPAAFLGCTMLMLLFAAGFTSMSRRIPRPGAFYTYISQGLGKPVGLGASFLALTTYGFNIMATLVFSGVAINNLLETFFGSLGIPWWVWAFGMLAAVWAFSYFNVELSAKILSTVLVVEVSAIAIFDIVVIGRGGAAGQAFAPWSPASLVTPSIGLLLLFSIGLFNGFEATAIYREEVRDPEKTIPRATYAAILFLGIFYAISSYALILASGVNRAVAAAQKDPAAMMPHALLIYFGNFANQIIAVLLVTSMLASTLSLQNILARYTHSLSVDGILPARLAAVHPKHGSPYLSAIAVGAIAFSVLVILALSGASELDLYGAMAGVAFYGMLLLLLLTAVAIIAYFRRDPRGVSYLKTFVAPLMAAVGIFIETIVATTNLDLLIPASHGVVVVLLAINYVAIAIGIFLAIGLKRSGSAVYDHIGRQAG